MVRFSLASSLSVRQVPIGVAREIASVLRLYVP